MRPRPVPAEARAAKRLTQEDAGVLDLDLVAVEQGDAAVRLSPVRAARLRGAAGGILTSTRPELKKARGIFFFFIYLLGGGLRRIIV
jgi:hypothetical protein